MSIFVGVVDAGTFTAAAKVLGMPKSTVSKRVAELEDRLGCRLLHRTTRRVTLTAAGSGYYTECRRIVADARAADHTVTARDGELRGVVRVTAPWLSAESIAPVVHRFLAANENMSVDLWITNRRVDLVEEGIDIAIRAGVLPDSSLVARRLGEGEHCVCASLDYLAGRPPVAKPSDLRSHSCISYARRSGQQTWTFERGGKKTSVPVNGRHAVTSAVLVHRAALAGLGIASLPTFLVYDDLTAGRLVRLLEGWTIGRGSINLVYPSGRHMSAGARALIDLFVATFQDNSPWSASPVPRARAAPKKPR